MTRPIGRFLNKARMNSASKSLEDFAKRIRTHKLRLSKIEKGARMRDLDILLAALKESDIHPAELAAAVLDEAETDQTTEIADRIREIWLSDTTDASYLKKFADVMQEYNLTPLSKSIISSLIDNGDLSLRGAALLAEFLSMQGSNR